MAYIDCDKCSHGKVCAYRHQYDDHIVTCSHWKPVAEARKLTHQKIVSELDGADVFLRGRATSKTASLNEYDIEVLLGIANVCDEAADFIQRRDAEIKELQSEIKILKDSNINLHELYQNEKEKVAKAKQKAIDIGRALKTAKAEAFKEFAERLCDGRVSNDPVVIAADALLKEMTEEAHYEIRKDLADL